MRENFECQVDRQFDEADLWSGLQNAWDAWRSAPDGLDGIDHGGAVELAVDSWPEAQRARPIEWLRRRIAAGEQPGYWRTYGISWGWGKALFDHDDDPRAELIDSIELNHCELEPSQLQRLVRRARQVRELVLVEANILPSIEALFAPEATWSSLERLHIEACGNENDLRAIARANLPALRNLVLVDEEPLPPITIELASASWWRQLRGLTLGEAADGILLTLAAREMPLLGELRLSQPSAEVLAAWRNPVLRPQLLTIETL